VRERLDPCPRVIKNIEEMRHFTDINFEEMHKITRNNIEEMQKRYYT
jgi:hypothetical protein